MMVEEVKKCERLTSMRTIIGERKPNDRYDVRSWDCHAMDAQISYEYESYPMELVGVHLTRLLTKIYNSFEEAHHWNIQAMFYSVRVPT